ncbi:SRPBCC family protein [Paenibacillus glycanilyticus]|uniref:SRPBCC family protein n=1 Tax=Paenibacillus glycanilyticus TaxID=126569 RepID=UPI000FD77BDE|nr:SRPBCC family protein [Paenibacillus glycanilyticus]
MIITDKEYPRLNRDGDKWVLVLVRTLEHPIDEVWATLTEAEQLASWGPFKPERDLVSVGAVQLEHIDMPEAETMQGTVLEVTAPELLVLQWGDDILRWELSGDKERTILVLKHRFMEHKQAPSYAAGWHLCLAGLAGRLEGKDMPSMVGHKAYNFGYKELYSQYAKLLGMEQEISE